MRDTEPMPTVRPSAPTRAKTPREPSRPPGSGVRSGAAVLAAFAALVAAAALFACAYLHGEVVALRADVRASRLATNEAERAVDRATLEVRSARAALANVEPVDTPEPVEPAETPEPADPNSGE